MLGGIANGTTHVTGFLAGEDCLSTLSAMTAMGVSVERFGETEVRVEGVGLHGLAAPAGPLDLGNSGTGMRLMTGLLCAQAFDTELTGDASLRSRPMQRVITPLTEMGARIDSNSGKPPLRVSGGQRLTPIAYAMPVASAQVKSSILLAGLYADGVTSVTEPGVTRDHTERMLRTMGVDVDSRDGTVRLAGRQSLVGSDIRVPADLSSATFPMLATLISPDAELLIRDVGLNPTRTGVLDIFEAMGADIAIENRRRFGDEPVADLRVRSSRLKGIDVDPALVSLAIDEFPALFVAAARADGTTRFSGLEELRVKESDRIASMAAGLTALGAQVEETPDGAVITGGSLRGGVADCAGDHRVAMSLAIAGSVAEHETRIDDVAAVNTSFPAFDALMRRLGAAVELETSD